MALPGRTNDTLVKAIIETDGVASLDPFIDAANYLVTTVCAVIPNGGVAYTADNLTMIETWLAAHFYAIYDPRTLKNRISTLNEQIESKVEIRLNVTRYGQMAMFLDVNGGLATLNNAMTKQEKALPAATNGLKGGLKWGGTPYRDSPCLDSIDE